VSELAAALWMLDDPSSSYPLLLEVREIARLFVATQALILVRDLVSLTVRDLVSLTCHLNFVWNLFR
jgi:hypothetical protein